MRALGARTWGGVLLAAALLLTGCGGADDDAGGSSGSGAQRDEASDGGLTGEPIRVMAAGSFDVPETGTVLPESPGAAQARAQAINEAGGIGGRPIEVIECNVGIDPNLTEQCARQAVDEDVVAVVGFNASTGDSFYPIVEEAGIPVIGSSPITPASIQSEVAFPLSSGLLGVFAGLPVTLAQRGVTEQSFVITDLGAPSAAADEFLRWSAERNDVTLTDTVLVPPDTTDFGAVAASTLRGDVEGVNLFIIGSGTGSLIQQIRAEDPDIPIVLGDGFLSRQLIDSLGETAEGLLVVSGYHFESEIGQEYLADMEAYDPSLETNDTAAEFWLPMWTLEQVLQDIDDPTAATVLEAMGQIEDMDMGGMVPPLTTTEELEFEGAPIPMPRAFNTTVTVYEIVDGERVELDPEEFLDVFS